MNFYAVNFPNFTTVVLKVKKQSTIRGLVITLTESSGLVGVDGTIYNPKLFQSVTALTSPDERQQNIAREADKVLF